MKIECYFDGACEPKNPGGAMGVGAIILIDGEKVFEHSSFTPPGPDNTNNVAEYMAFEKILDWLLENGHDKSEVSISGDSQLVVKQMTFEWGMNSGAYIPFAERCQKKLMKFVIGKLKIQWIPREKNEQADNLSKSELLGNGIQITDRSAWKKKH